MLWSQSSLEAPRKVEKRTIETIEQLANLAKDAMHQRGHLNSWTPPCFLQPKCPRWKHWPSAKRQSESCGIHLLEWRQRLRNRQSWYQTSKRRNPCVLYVHQSLPAWRTCRRHHTEGNRWSIRLRARAEHYGWVNLVVPSAQICPPMPTCQQMPIRRVQRRQRRTSVFFKHHGLQELCQCPHIWHRCFSRVLHRRQRHSCLTLLWGDLIGHSCGTLLPDTFVDTLVGNTHLGQQVCSICMHLSKRRQWREDRDLHPFHCPKNNAVENHSSQSHWALHIWRHFCASAQREATAKSLQSGAWRTPSCEDLWHVNGSKF